MIRLDGVSKRYGGQILLVEASASVNRGEKVGLVGPNGAGKSTVFRMMMRDELPDEGQVSVQRNITIGYFSQDVGEMSGRPVVAETMAGAGPVSDVAVELRELEHALGDPARADEMEALLERFGDVQARFDELGGYALEARAREILAALEQDELSRGARPALSDPRAEASEQLGLFQQPAVADDRITRRLREADLDRTTPIEALQLLAELKKLADEV